MGRKKGIVHLFGSKCSMRNPGSIFGSAGTSILGSQLYGGITKIPSLIVIGLIAVTMGVSASVWGMLLIMSILPALMGVELARPIITVRETHNRVLYIFIKNHLVY